MKKNISLAALIEMSGSLLLLLCMLLPWFQFSLNESVESFSFWGRTGFVNWADRYLCDYWLGYSNFGYLLYLFPIMCVANIIMQYFFRLPWFSFYAGVLSAFAVLLAYHYRLDDMLYFVRLYARLGNVSSAHLGIGAILTAVISMLMMISAWTHLGWYYKRYRIYIIIVVVYCIVGCAGLHFSWASSGLLLGVFLLGAVHVPFLVYWLLVILCSWFVSHRRMN